MGVLSPYVPLEGLFVLGSLLVIGLLNSLRTQPFFIPEWLLAILVFLGMGLLLPGLCVENFWSKVIGFLFIVIGVKALSPWEPSDLGHMLFLILLGAFSASALNGAQSFLPLLLTGLLGFWATMFGQLGRKNLALNLKEVLFVILYGFGLTGLVLAVSLFGATLIPWSRLSLLKLPSWKTWNASLAQGTLNLRDVTVFRVVWLSGPQIKFPRWRIITYDTYYRGHWLKLYRLPFTPRNQPEKKTKMCYLVEPSQPLEGLPLLGLPTKQVFKGIKVVVGANWLGLNPISNPVKICVKGTSSWPQDLDPKKYLQVPINIKNRLRPLVEGLIKPTPLATARNMVRFLRAHYRYSLDAGKADTDPVLYFLFEHKKGHCQYWATALALMLRTAGIPSRVVAGYAGGLWVSPGHYYIVREREAHFWVEVWTGNSWVYLDPTPYFAPGKSFDDFLREWNDYILFLSQKYNPFLTIYKLWPKIALIIILIGLGLPLFLFVLRHRKSVSKDHYIGEEYLKLLARKGLSQKPGETIFELTLRAQKKWPALRPLLEDFVNAYHDTIYGKQNRLKELKRILKELKKSGSRTP